MGISITNLYLNNVRFAPGTPPEVRFAPLTLNWDYETTSKTIRQNFYEVRIGTNDLNLGTDQYVPDTFRQPLTRSQADSWRLRTKFMDRGVLYFGQIRLVDNMNERSDWISFRFRVNTLPFVADVEISPAEPDVNDDLELSFSTFETTSNKIRWFKNGVHMTQFDDYTKISRDYLRYTDIWVAQVTPIDMLEEGPSIDSNAVMIQKAPPAASQVEIFPRNPNTYDILEASWSAVDEITGRPILNDKSKIKWYINNGERPEAENSKFVRFELVPGDEIFFELTPSDGIFDGPTVASEVVTIEDGGFRILGLRVDGISENLNVKSVNPTIEWDVIEPVARRSRYAFIRIGTAPQSGNIYETTIETFDEKFTVPDNVLKRGEDYFVTVAASDESDSFTNPVTTRFRVAGSLWDSSVSNSTGWTIEAALRVEGEGDNVGYQRISLSDGTAFAEIRFYLDRVTMLLGKSNAKTYALDMTVTCNFIITGQGSTIKVYQNNALILDGTDEFTQSAEERFIEIGSGAGAEAAGLYKRIVYTVNGSFDPITNSSIYTDISLESFINFVGGSVSDITEHQGDVLVAVNSRNTDESGTLYRIVETEMPILAATENIDNFPLVVNSMSGSPDDRFTFISHSKGASYFENFFLASFDINSIFESGYSPSVDNWELVQSIPFNATSYTSSGLVLDTTFGNVARVDDRLQFTTQTVSGLRFSWLWDFFTPSGTFDFSIYTQGSQLFVWSDSLGSALGSVSLLNRTLEDVRDELLDPDAAWNQTPYFFNIFVKVDILNGLNDQPASNLEDTALDGIDIGSPVTIFGDFLIVDPYDPDPYSKTAGGKWFYSHRRPGTPWFDRVSNSSGWTVDFDVTVETTEDNDRPSDIGNPDGFGLYVNDGAYYENLKFMTQEVYLNEADKSFLIDNTQANRYRITGQDDNIRVYVRRPNTIEYELLGETKMTESGTAAANAGRVAAASDDSGNIYAVWHDDGDGSRRQLYFAEFDSATGWSDPFLLVSDEFGAQNPDIAVDGNGIIYIVFETLQSDYTDLAVIQRTSEGWSDPYLIASDEGDSVNPAIAIDRNNTVCVVWEDHRFIEPEIFFAQRVSSNGQWESSAFGRKDLRITNSPAGAYRPSIAISGLTIAVSFTSFTKDGNSQIYVAIHGGEGGRTLTSAAQSALARYTDAEVVSILAGEIPFGEDANIESIFTDIGVNNGTEITGWNSSAQGGSDIAVSAPDAEQADHSDMVVDNKGRLFVTWHDVVNGTYQVFARRANPRFTTPTPIAQLTNANLDSRYPKATYEVLSGSIYIAFERGEVTAVDPYNPYGDLDDQNISAGDAKIMLARYNNEVQRWESSNQTHTTSGGGGGFDVEIEEGDTRIARRPVVANRSRNGEVQVLYEGLLTSEQGKVLEFNQNFATARSARFDLTWEPVYNINDGDPYVEKDVDLSGKTPRKEIRFGDFSNTVGVKYIISRVRYYLGGAYGPFNIRFVSPATVNMPNANVFDTVSNNRGDAWLGTNKGLFYFNNVTNEAFVFSGDEFGIDGLEIRGIVFDRDSNMYLATNNGVFVSVDHAFFYKLTGEGIPDEATSIDTDSQNRVFVGSFNGVTVIPTAEAVAQIKTTKENATTERTIEITTAQILNEDAGLVSNRVYVVRIDANDVAWIGTNKGLVRYSQGQFSTFTMANGLSSSKINDIAIKNTAIRFIATTAGVDKMTGVTVERLDFGNLGAPIVGVEDRKPDVSIPQFTNVRSVRWKHPNVLYIATTSVVYQVEFVDDAFQTEQIKITKFNSQDFSLTTITPERNDDLQTFRIVGLEDRTIPANVLYEVILNGNKITRGFRFSPNKQVLRFDYPLKASDIVQINVRFDVEVVNDFSQNGAQRFAVGNKATRLERLLSARGSIYTQTGGDINTLQINDETTDLPFDRITVDTQPPVGRVEIGQQLDQTVFRVNVRQIAEGSEYLPFDATSGIDKLIISNFTNFTTDGEIPQEPIPFVTAVDHDLGIVFDSITQEYEFPAGKGRYLFRWDRLDGSQRMVAGTGEPSKIYMYNPTTEMWEFKADLDDGNPNSSIEFITSFQGRLIVGTGIPDGIGKVWTSTDGENFVVIGTLPVSHAYAAEELGAKLYIAAGGNIGQVYAWDGQTFTLAFDNISGHVYDLVQADGELYAGTGREGRIYRLDPTNSTQQIIDANSDPDIISVGFANINNKSFVFSGTGSTATLRRSTLPDGAFVHSFRTLNAPVYDLENVGGTLYAAIGNTLYANKNVWNAEFTHTEDIRDIARGLGDVPWFVSDSFVFKVGEATTVKNVYMKLIDRAGNETSLFVDDEQTTLDENLFDSVTLEQLVEFTNQNRILEVDGFGNVVPASTISGDERFYSADKIDVEQGSYFSEIFNGTNSLVSWDRINWDATIPENTTMTIFVRTGDSRDDILDNDFEIEVDGTEGTYDISFLSKQYIQFKIVMTSKIRGLSPSLRSVVIRSIASQSTHFYTTNFVLPSRVKSGIITSTKMIPVAADVVFGINTNNSVDFAEYQIIDENRIFTTADDQVGRSVRVGIKLITPSKGEVLSEDFGEYGPYDTDLFFNSINWSYTNSSGSDGTYHFRVSFYENFTLTNPIYTAYSGQSTSGFSDNGDVFQTTGAIIEAGDTKEFSFVPVGDTPIRCNTFYFLKVEVQDDQSVWTTVFDNRSFVEACGTSFVDSIDFDFTNSGITDTFHYRIRFFSNPERTELLTTAFSGNDTTGWSVDGEDFPAVGLSVNGGQTKTVLYEPPDLSVFEVGLTYYLSIDAFDGTEFVNNSNSFTFRARDIDTGIYCGPYVDVPVVKNLSLMFELEGNEFVTLKLT